MAEGFAEESKGGRHASNMRRNMQALTRKKEISFVGGAPEKWPKSILPIGDAAIQALRKIQFFRSLHDPTERFKRLIRFVDIIAISSKNRRIKENSEYAHINSEYLRNASKHLWIYSLKLYDENLRFVQNRDSKSRRRSFVDRGISHVL